ncbi:MAG: lysylphosphatidylglycerol synthase transmembrane domain-containing protein [Myxococcales bacterium]|nr:lysylphosphatidylglycerol synthase transmembrane domain-containing protein [Myxococcales bacterium]
MEREQVRPPPPPMWRRLAPLVGVALLVWILSGLQGARVMAALSSVSALHVGVAALAFSCNVLVKALRWRRMLVAQGIHVPAPITRSTFLAAVFYGQFTIGRLGELFRAEALLERGVPLGRALSSCVFDRVLDLYLVLALGAVLGALVFGEAEAALWAAGILLSATAGGLAVVAVEAGAGPDLLRAPVQRLVAFVQRLPLGGGLVSSVRDLVSGVRPLLSPRPLLEAGAWTLIAWTGYFAALYALALGMGVGVGPIVLTAAATLAALSSLLPITVSGLGARELIYAELLGRHAVETEVAIVLALLHLAVMTGCVVIAGGAGIWARARQPASAGEH